MIGAAWRPVRVAALVALLFIAADFALAHRLERRFAGGDFRLPNDSDQLLPEYLQWLAAQPNRKVYFIGDSTMAGPRLPPAATIPGQFAREPAARAWRVANFGLIAAKLPDFFYLAAKVPARRGEVAILNVNYKNFSPSDLSVPLRFHNLYDPALNGIAGADSAQILGVAGAPPGRVDAFVRRHWFLYRNRDWVNENLFGIHPRKLLKSYFQVVTRTGVRGMADRLLRRRHKPNWTAARWDPWAVDALRAYYAVPLLDDANAVFRFLAPTARLARERGLTPVFFANPMNRELADRFQLVDWPTYVENLRRIRAAVEAGGGVFLDYTDLVPSTGFQDNDHLTADGAQRVAAKLAADCAPYLAVAGGGP
jgi:lysophospholipase L1-like esterase